MQTPPRIKVCCIADPEEAALAVQLGASALGLVSHMPSGPGVIDEEQIAAIVDTVPPAVSTFLLTSLTKPQAIVEQVRRCRVNTVQLVDTLGDDDLKAVRDALSGVTVVQVIHVTGSIAVKQAQAVQHVHGLLLDSGDPSKPVKVLGGTGQVHDWSLSRKIVASVQLPVFLAGGLRSDNVREALRTVGPYGVDVCSGVRSQGKLDRTRLSAFIDAVHRG